LIGQTLGHYQILQELGVGGMGVVYLAQDMQLGRRVAVKLLPEASLSNPANRVRFEREAKIIASMSHPNIVTLYSIEEDREVRFLTMEAIDGKTLAQVIPLEGLAVEEILRLAVPLADAVAAAHDHGITHRDLKPGNIMVTAAGRVKVLDFGLAKLLTDDSTQLHGLAPETLTREGIVVGTLSYMAPEQLQGRAADARSDVFALGVVLFEMATGVRPFSGQNSADIITAVLRDPPPFVGRLKPDLPGPLSDVVMRCLEKAPDARFASAAEVRDALLAAQSKITSTTPLQQSTHRLLRRGRTHLRGIGLAAGILALVAAGFFAARGALRAPTQGSAAETTMAVPSLVVLPLGNFTGEAGYFVDGMTDGIISALARLGKLRVISRQSAMHYKGSSKLLPEIAQELGVGYCLEGTTQREHGEVQFSVKLIQPAPHEKLILARTFRRNEGEIQALHDEVALAVATSLQVEMSGSEARQLRRSRTVDPAAYEAYLQGSELIDRVTTAEGFRQGVALLERAVELEPQFAAGWAALADTLVIQGYLFSDPKEARARAELAVRQALEADPESGSAHIARGYLLHFYDWDWDAAASEYRRGLELNPGLALGHQRLWALLESQGRHQEAGGEIARALLLDPLSSNINANQAVHWMVIGDYDQARAQLDLAISRWPDDFAARLYRWQLLAVTNGTHGEVRMALREMLRTLGFAEMLPEFDRRDAAEGLRPAQLWAATHLAAAADKGRVPAAYVAELFQSVGDTASALTWLRRGLAERSPEMAFFTTSPRWRALRREPDYQAILAELKLPPI
jgi:eukaryotic-like serine/threonine-protein kinase